MYFSFPISSKMISAPGILLRILAMVFIVCELRSAGSNTDRGVEPGSFFVEKCITEVMMNVILSPVICFLSALQ